MMIVQFVALPAAAPTAQQIFGSSDATVITSKEGDVGRVRSKKSVCQSQFIDSKGMMDI